MVWLLLILAVIGFVLGFVTTAKVLFIIAAVLLLLSLFTGFRSGWGWGRRDVV